MKKSLLVILMALVLTSGVAFADPQGEATGHVYIKVLPNIAVGVVTANVDLGGVLSGGGIQTGKFAGEVTFRIDANKQDVKIAVGATNLYKGDSMTQPDGSASPVIPLDVPLGVEITPANGHKTASADNKVPYNGSGININALDGRGTDLTWFTSSQVGHFSQNVVVKIGWDQSGGNEFPEGDYSGWVKLTATVM